MRMKDVADAEVSIFKKLTVACTLVILYKMGQGKLFIIEILVICVVLSI